MEGEWGTRLHASSFPVGFVDHIQVKGHTYSYLSCNGSAAELSVMVTNDTVTEGQNVTFTCMYACPLSQKEASFVWYKNAQPLSKKNTANCTAINNTLHLAPVSSEDAGSYACGVNGYEDDLSLPVTLSVRYAPKAVSASVNPSGEIHEGSSVTLICNSDANPQVHNHTWYKMTASESVLVGSEKNLPIPDITLDDAGMYYCTATNELGEVNSSMMVIKVTGKMWLMLVAGGSVLGVLTAVTLIAIIIINVVKRRPSKDRKDSKPDDKDGTYAALDPKALGSAEYDTLSSSRTPHRGN